MSREKIILITIPLDNANIGSQSLNAKSLVQRFGKSNLKWVGVNYNNPAESISKKTNVKLIKLWRKHFWYLHKVLIYQKNVDAIFYPGVHLIDYIGIKVRKFFFRSVPIIATLEGLVGDEELEMRISKLAGHNVYCQKVDTKALLRVKKLLDLADHVIAISPFLAKIGSKIYGDKFSYLPLGVDLTNFYQNVNSKNNKRFKVLCVGSLLKQKGPELFVEMARKFPQADFVWVGDGKMREELMMQIRDLVNIKFEPSMLPTQIGDVMRSADLFVLPSISEGVPKVTQEAAACGLPIIVFGYYEPPTVVHNENGYVAWTNEEFVNYVGEIINNRNLAKKMGEIGTEMSKKWSWDYLAPQWEQKINDLV